MDHFYEVYDEDSDDIDYYGDHFEDSDDIDYYGDHFEDSDDIDYYGDHFESVYPDMVDFDDWSVDRPEVMTFNDNKRPFHQGNYNSKFGAHIYEFLLKYLCIINMKWVPFRWLFIILNVVVEVCQATITQENAEGKIRTSLYLKLSVVTSCVCLLISLTESIHDGKENKVVWRRKTGYFGWFYYSARDQMWPYDRFAIIFGVASSIIQFFVNILALVINQPFVKFDMLPLLLSFGYLVAALVDNGGKDTMKCEIHGKAASKCSHCFSLKQIIP